MPAWLSSERLLGLLLVGSLWLPVGWIGVAAQAGVRFTLLLFVGWQVGEVFLHTIPSRFWRILLGISAWAASLSLLLTALYYLNIPLHNGTHLLIESLLGLVGIVLARSLKMNDERETLPPIAGLHSWRERLFSGAVVATALLSFGLLIYIAGGNATRISLRTPWPLLPKGGFLLFTIPFAASLLLAWKARRPLASFTTNAASWLSISLLAPILYPLGYGFDGFIHRASEAVLQATGTLTPKPLYYIGQYVWTTWLAQTFDLSIKAADTWLVPLGVLLPLAALAIWQREETSRHWAFPLTLLFLPLSAFVTTTPQSFSYVLGFSAIIGTLWTHQTRRSWIFPLLWAFWATVTHPLGGLPILLFVGGAWLASFYERPWKRSTLLALGSLGALLAIPLAFWAQSGLGNTPITWSWTFFQQISWKTLVPSVLLNPRQTLSLWVDATEWVRLSLEIGLIASGIWQAIRPQKPLYRWLALVGLGLLGVQWLLEHVATFGFLITYERGNYTERLGVLSALCLAPLAAAWAGPRIGRLATRSGLLFGCLLLALTAAWPLHVYDSLPRHDAARASSGWSVGAADLEAIHWMQARAQGAPYTVLANQSVSAAALETYGFARYAGDVFYYPIPTGGPLYQSFLRVASTEGTADDLKKAATLTRSHLVFVVINDYWWNADLVRDRLAAGADQQISFGNGAVWVYQFNAETLGATTGR